MQDKAITAFLDKKKQDYLKKNIATDPLETWLTDASSRAKQLSLTSHPAKFVHPSAKVSNIIVEAKKECDGLLRSGNVEVELDVVGNAAASDIGKFLSIQLQDKKTILQHLEQDTEVIRQQFETTNTKFEDIRDGFMQIKRSDLVEQTSEKLKQVYFPVGGDYHLLSILNASGIIYKLKHKINELRFSEENKTLREELKKATPAKIKGTITKLPPGLLTSIGYGGTKPQNISHLNNQNKGFSFLLSSTPPTLEKRPTQPPKTDFFNDCLWVGLFKSDFEHFHNVLSSPNNNKAVRNKRDDIVLNSIIKLKRLIDNIREISTGWSDSETYNGLARWQKIWLDDQYIEIRDDEKQNQGYLTEAQRYFANWFIGNYKHSTKDNKLLGDDDIAQIKKVLKYEQALLK